MPTNKISISFSSHCTDIYNYLKTKENISTFICQLVRVEMTAKDTISPDMEAKIEAVIKKVLSENQYSTVKTSQNTASEKIINSLSDDDKSLIKDLF
jgi:hypothetical protein